MLLDHLKPGVIVRGPIFPEPIQVIMVTPMGKSIKLIGKGLTSGKLHDPILTPDQLAFLEATPEKEPFDGDPKRFRLGIEALRLAIMGDAALRVISCSPDTPAGTEIAGNAVSWLDSP